MQRGKLLVTLALNKQQQEKVQNFKRHSLPKQQKPKNTDYLQLDPDYLPSDGSSSESEHRSNEDNEVTDRINPMGETRDSHASELPRIRSPSPQPGPSSHRDQSPVQPSVSTMVSPMEVFPFPKAPSRVAKQATGRKRGQCRTMISSRHALLKLGILYSLSLAERSYFVGRKRHIVNFPVTKDEGLVPTDDVKRVLPVPDVRRGLNNFKIRFPNVCIG
ncbi:hypothetical protein FQR65_LT13793 [Abscondita terminalis]|nr:hypothetical protein FQR65_LT13793 [Abscondita terminalis]